MTCQPSPSLVRRLLFLLLCLPGLALAAQDQAAAGKLVKMKGHVEYLSSGSNAWLPPQVGQAFFNGDSVRTGENGLMALLMADETLVQLHRNSLFLFKEVPPNSGWNKIRGFFPAADETPKSTYKVEKGEVWLLNKNRAVDIDVETPSMSAAVRGTEFTIRVEDDGLVTVRMQEGVVQVANAQGSLVIGSGEEAFARPGEAPQKRMLLEPENAVQWTILLPQLKDFAIHEGEPSVREALQLLATGDLSQARQRLEELAAKQPESAPARELLAIVALAKGDSETALRQAGWACELAPQAAMPWVIKAYAYQAGFALEQAMEAVNKALAHEPDNVTALVVQARLHFGMGYTPEAKRTVEHALAIEPGHGDANNLLGFIQLASRAEEEAKSSFSKAINADSSLAEPHLGLGLLAMRQGAEDSALEEISTAVLLEPRRSLYRSYWAKMLYQLNRHQKALDVLDISQRLDSRDPTPDLYRAIIHRDLRQPGQAIASLNQAIKKNDNRAVYRSRLLLDRDLAVKNVDLSLMYDQLGLLTWARQKATASLYDDYTNASAHLFYAGTLTGGDGRTWSRNSENLLARLLMPANANTFNSFNDYTTFFERPSFEADYAGTAGTQGTAIHKLTTFGALPKANLTFSAQYLPYQTEGWQEGYFDRSRTLTAYLKWDMTPAQGFMFSGTGDVASHGGKLTPRYEYDDLPEIKDSQEREADKLEIGYHFTLKPGTELLLHAARVRDNERLLLYDKPTYPFPFPFSFIRVTDFKQVNLAPDYALAQGEVIHRQGSHQLILGGFYHNPSGDGKFLKLKEMAPPGNVVLFDQASFDDTSRMITAYVQDIWRINKGLTLDGALYSDHLRKSEVLLVDLEHREWSLDEISPRLGVLWSPLSGHTFKAAASRSLLPLDGDYLAPADVAGVPVHRNGQTGTITEEGDLVWEYELGKGLLANTLFAYERNYTVPTGAGQMMEQISRGKGLRSVFETLLGERVGLALNYRFDRIGDNDPTLNRDEHFVSAALSWVHPVGVSLKATEGYRAIGFESRTRGHEDMLLTDVELAYEFPAKTGSLNLTINNLFDEHFNWLTDAFITDGRIPAREAFLTLNVTY